MVKRDKSLPTAESSATANLPTEICLTWSPTSCTPARSIMLLNYIVTCHTVTILPSGETGKNWARHRLKAGTSALPTTCMYCIPGTVQPTRNVGRFLHPASPHTKTFLSIFKAQGYALHVYWYTYISTVLNIICYIISLQT